jgi:hypothetical protein
MGLLQGFIDKSPSALMGAFDFAQALMADGPNFKRGYPADSAYIVTIERARTEGITFNEGALGEALGFTAEETERLLAIATERAAE